MEKRQSTIQLLSGQYKFLHSGERISKYQGGLGSGKSFSLTLLSLIHATQGRDVLYLLPTFRMIKDVAIPCLKDHIANMGLKLDEFSLTLSPPTFIIKVGDKTGSILFRSATNPDSLRGVNVHDLFVDEAGYIHVNAYLIAAARARVMHKDDPINYHRIAGTPTGLGHWFSELTKPGTIEPVETITQSTLASPYLSDDYKRDLISQYGGLDSLWARQELLGEIVDLSGANIFIPIQDIIPCWDRLPVVSDDDPIIMGVDVGSEHGDPSGIVIRQGYRMLWAKKYRTKDGLELATEIQSLCYQHDIAAVVIDAVGIGSDVPSIVKERMQSMNVFASKNSWKGDSTNYNNRALLWGRMKKWLIKGGSLFQGNSISERDWRDELCKVQFSVKSDKILLESKFEMRARNIKSPNLADALSVTFEGQAQLAISPHKFTPPVDGYLGRFVG